MSLLSTKSHTNNIFKTIGQDVAIYNSARDYEELYPVDENKGIANVLYSFYKEHDNRDTSKDSQSFNILIEEELPKYAKEASIIRKFLLDKKLINEHDRIRLLELGFKEDDIRKTIGQMNLHKLTCDVLQNTYNYMFELVLAGVEGIKSSVFTNDYILYDIAKALDEENYSLPGYKTPIMQSISKTSIDKMNSICDELIKITYARESSYGKNSYLDDKSYDNEIRKRVNSIKKEIESAKK